MGRNKSKDEEKKDENICFPRVRILILKSNEGSTKGI